MIEHVGTFLFWLALVLLGVPLFGVVVRDAVRSERDRRKENDRG